MKKPAAEKTYTIQGITAGAVVFTETVTGYAAAQDRLSAIVSERRAAGTSAARTELRGPTGHLFIWLC